MSKFRRRLKASYWLVFKKIQTIGQAYESYLTMIFSKSIRTKLIKKWHFDLNMLIFVSLNLHIYIRHSIITDKNI